MSRSRKSTGFVHKFIVPTLSALAAFGVVAVELPASATNSDHPDSVESNECGVGQHLFTGSSSSTTNACTATTLRADLLVTAAHCICDGTYNPLNGNCVGSWLDSVDGVHFTAARPGSAGDIALLLTDEPLSTANDQCRRCISSDHNNGDPVTIVGYGSGFQESIDTTTSLNSLFGAYQFAGDTMCQGDSGGPVLSETGAVLATNSGGWPVIGDCGEALGSAYSSPVTDDIIDLLTRALQGQTPPVGGIVVNESEDASSRRWATAHCFSDFYNNTLGVDDTEIDPSYSWSYSFSFDNAAELESFYANRGLVYFDFVLANFGTQTGSATIEAGEPIVVGSGAAVSCRGSGANYDCRGVVSADGIRNGVILDVFADGETTCEDGRGEGNLFWTLNGFTWGDTATDAPTFDANEVCL